MTGFAGEGADVAQTEDRGSIGHNRYQIAASSVLEGIVRIGLDGQARLGYSRGVGQA